MTRTRVQLVCGSGRWLVNGSADAMAAAAMVEPKLECLDPKCEQRGTIQLVESWDRGTLEKAAQPVFQGPAHNLKCRENVGDSSYRTCGKPATVAVVEYGNEEYDPDKDLRLPHTTQYGSEVRIVPKPLCNFHKSVAERRRYVKPDLIDLTAEVILIVEQRNARNKQRMDADREARRKADAVRAEERRKEEQRFSAATFRVVFTEAGPDRYGDREPAKWTVTSDDTRRGWPQEVFVERNRGEIRIRARNTDGQLTLAETEAIIEALSKALEAAKVAVAEPVEA